MSPTNKEIQLRKNCQLYAYVLNELGKEIPEEIQECSESFDYPVECATQLFQILQSLDSDTFNKIVKNKESQVACDLSNWWKMYQMYIPPPLSKH